MWGKRKIVTTALFFGIVSLFLANNVVNLNTKFVSATTFTQSYQSTTSPVVGTVVSLSKQGGNLVEPTTPENDSKLVGVVADTTGSIIDLQSKDTNLKIASSSLSKILICNLGGNVKKGDLLIISPLSGIAMKDTLGFVASKYIGVATEDFNTNTAGNKSVEVELTNGKKQTAVIGQITANILITERPTDKSAKSKNILSSIGEKIVGKQVNTLRVVASIIIVLTSLIITGLILNSSVRGTFMSIGRNPLARTTLISNLMKMILVTLIIFETGLIAAYLVLVL